MSHANTAGLPELTLLQWAPQQGKGVILGANEVYDLVTPPILGGSFDLGNVTAADFVVKVNLAGQLHDQLRRLPPGTKISGVSFDGATPAGKDAPPPRRRRWGRRS
jgi:hypothetical protein